jgi:hypothetical protein
LRPCGTDTARRTFHALDSARGSGFASFVDSRVVEGTHNSIGDAISFGLEWIVNRPHTQLGLQDQLTERTRDRCG